MRTDLCNYAQIANDETSSWSVPDLATGYAEQTSSRGNLVVGLVN